MTARVLVVTAVPAERDAVARAASGGPGAAPGQGDGGPGRDGGPHGDVRRTDVLGRELHRLRPHGAPGTLWDVLAAGVGPAAAASGAATALTAAALAGRPYALVVSAGIGGGFPGAVAPGGTAVASAVVAADLGARTPEGFLPVTELGFGTGAHHPPAALARAVAEAAGGVLGPVLTVSTVTGTAADAAELVRRHPGAVAEAMEGFGVAEAAAAHGVPVLEVRTVSNAVGPRDRAAWRIPEALAALTGTFRATAPVLEGWLTDD
ncbi:futalosine hydrolase [Streptomyces sp. TRM 70351]|uniref:futalosine hydrolase n=1 Tax=Streptomyces sp. TRM 70351 TaxID=3116552 RepID=UPI002E7B53EE|nr:futalosine hydrolase [Streptomyces sp. TRM 70351]MEE1929621.1 futalosine hydrolase [Streptomyces sp. TRM 70351]